MSQQGIKFKANPTSEQKLILSQWMGCARFIYNAKCDEDQYLRTFLRHSLSLTGEKIPIDQTYSQFKTELTPWLKDCPSQILRNSAVRWYEAYQRYFQGLAARPTKKKKGKKDSIWLTRELFQIEIVFAPKTKQKNYQLFIGTKTNNIGYLNFVAHRDFLEPNSISISKKNGNYYVSFNYENGLVLKSQEQLIEEFSKLDEVSLIEKANGLDRGVIVPVMSSTSQHFDFTDLEKQALAKCEARLKFYQKKLARQKLGSKRREQTKRKIANLYQHMANIRKDFAHKTTHSLVNSDSEIFVLEDLKVKNMTASPKAKLDVNEKTYLPNGSSAKAGLNKAILNSCWGLIATFMAYKAIKINKLVIKVPPHHSSQECAKCGHIHPDNRLSQSEFNCIVCNNAENADLNAAKVIAKRGVKFLLDFSKPQSASSESSSAGTRKSARGGIIRPQKAKLSLAAQNSDSLVLSEINANC
ncbi:MAG: transposase [Acidobacteria bacterium]|nr:transposase [Acidobacteriota bacterium]